MVTVGEIRIGTSGWRYPEWRGGFYPRGLQQRLELQFLSRRLDTVEINGSFYGLRKPTDFKSWFERTPENFVFAVKGHREITHTKRLRDVAKDVEEFFDSGVLDLGPKLGPILWQLPPSLPWRPERFAAFLDLLPGPPVRHAIEVRHPSWDTPELVEVLARHGIALVVAESAGRFPEPHELTTDFVYARLHGDEELYVSAYSDQALDRWASRFREWSAARDVYVYFDNTMGGAAPFDALALAERLG
ncbi:DUF72 domain-containing protein [Saccharothrix sp. 6-C]|uniref:DUF72 domain-containing protein n=1 Tax=Saccharothrix sp. 6-C TaxID=2781735 RepID=UPI00191733FA|nr:DUF72 domain-containing protein [Saccharothrix sp. 6-C]QQQ80374.1 DUF72 domain-containing protein [Saccharothrix sp. 6-C]